MDFDAFISYSHAADGRLAPAVQSGLHRLARPLLQRRALRVFRDETGLSTNPHLWAAIEAALDASRWFVLLASPQSAASEWVDREVAAWLERKPFDHLLIVVTDGDLEFGSDGGVDCDRTNCLPPSLLSALQLEPRWLDLRWARDDAQLDLRNGRFRAAIADLAAPIHGLAKDELESEDVGQQRRARRLVTTGIAAVSILAIVSIIAALAAVSKSHTASRQRNQAIANALAAQAVAVAPNRTDLSLLLAAEGDRRSRSFQTETGLLAALGGARHDVGYVTGLPADFADVEATPDRSVIYISTTGGAIQGWDPTTWKPIGDPAATDIGTPPGLDISNDGRRLAYAAPDGAHVIDVATGMAVSGALGDGAGYAVLNSDGSQVAVTYGDRPAVDVYNVDTGALTNQVLADVQAGSSIAVFLADGDLLVAPFGGTELDEYSLDTASGRVVRTLDRVPVEGGLAVSPDGSWIIAGGLGGSAVVVETDTFTQVAGSLTIRGSRSGDFTFSPDSSEVSLSSDDGSFSVYRLGHTQTNPPAEAYQFETAEITGMTGGTANEFLGNNRILALSITDGQALVADISQAIAFGATTDIGLSITAIVTVDQSAIFSANGQIQRAPIDAMDTPTATADVFHDVISTIDVSEASGLVAVGGYDWPIDADAPTSTRIDVLDSGTFELITSIDTAGDRPEHVAFSPDGTKIAVGFRDSGKLGVYDSTTGAPDVEPFEVDTYPYALGTVVWTADGRRLFTGGQDGVLRSFDTTSWESTTEAVLAPEQAAIRYSTISQDGKTLLVPVESGELFLIDTATGQPVGAPISADGTQFQAAQFTADGKWIVVASRDGALRLWDAGTHRQVGTAIPAHVGSAQAMTSAPTGVITAGVNDGHIVVWNLDPGTWAQRACELAGRNLTKVEWNLYVGGTYRTTCAQWPSGT